MASLSLPSSIRRPSPGQIVVTAAVRDYVMNRCPVLFQNLPVGMRRFDNSFGLFASLQSSGLAGRSSRTPYLHGRPRPTHRGASLRTIGG